MKADLARHAAGRSGGGQNVGWSISHNSGWSATVLAAHSTPIPSRVDIYLADQESRLSRHRVSARLGLDVWPHPERGVALSSGKPVPFDLHRAKSVGQVIGDALRCYRLYPILFAELTLAVVVPYALIVLLLDGGGLLGQQHQGVSASLVVSLLDVLLVAPLISALHIHAVIAIGEQRRPTLSDVFARGVRVLPVVAAAEIVAGLGTFLGFLLLIVPGLILLARWAVVAQVAATERTDWLGALRRGAQLTAGNYWHVLGVVLTVAILNQLLDQVGSALEGSSANSVQVIVGIVVATITLSFAALTAEMLFFDLLARTAPRGSAGS